MYTARNNQTKKRHKILNIFKYSKSLVIFTIVAILGLMTYSLINTSPQKAKAAPTVPPESCFAFTTTAGEVTITDYYDHEDNNSNNSACTREVEIPSTLGGNPVTVISNSSFTSRNITAVIIPDSVTDILQSAFKQNQISILQIGNQVESIGDEAFSSNSITSIVIPDSVTALGEGAFSFNLLENAIVGNEIEEIKKNAFASNHINFLQVGDKVKTISAAAFAGNQIEYVNIPNSVDSVSPTSFVFQTIPGGTDYLDLIDSSYDPVALNSFYESAIITRIYTFDSSNPKNHQNSVLFENDIFSSDFNGNTLNDFIGGHIINPAPVTTVYHDQDGNEISSSQTFTGQGLTTYLAKDYPSPDNTLSLYYRAGNMFTPPSPPAIAGYEIVSTPNPVNLITGNNEFIYTYKVLGSNTGAGSESNSGSNNPGDNPSNQATANSSNQSSQSKLSNTGINVIVFLLTAAIIVLSTVSLTKKAKQKSHYTYK